MGSENLKRDQYSEKSLRRSSFSIRAYTPRSISRALTLSLIVTITLVAMAGILSMYFFQMAKVDRELSVKADAYLSHFINALEIPLLNVDTDTVKVIGNNISQDELIVYLLIRLDDGQEIFSYEDTGDGERINRSSQIIHKDLLVGYVEYAVTKELYKKEGHHQLLLFCGATILVLISLAFATGLFVRIFLKKPLDALNQMANSYVQGEPDPAVAEIPYYEFQQFGRVLAQMGATINKQLATLRKLNEELEQRVAERTAELVVAKEGAEASNRAKSDFLAQMSHEIRTPLNAITGLTNIVLKSELTGEQREYLQKTQIASNNLLAVINDILDFSKVEAGRLELNQAAFNLDQILEKLADLFSDRVTQKDLELIFTIDRRIPRQLIGDAGRLSQVLTNLVANAVKFTEQGEIIVAVELDDNVETHSGETPLKFQVSDTGVGIDADMLPTLFDPFTQAEDYLTRKHEGTGLGLAICRRLVQLMDGRIWAESTPGLGSTFCFTIVVEVEAKKDKTLRNKLPPDLLGIKTLVVDDSAASRKMLSDLLKSLTLIVETVDSCEKAIEELHRAATDEPYQLVMVDWRMPGMDGIEAARRIRELEFKVEEQADPSVQSISQEPSVLNHEPIIPIIIMVTAYGLELVNDSADSLAKCALLLKPVKPSRLINTIMELFGRAPAIPRVKSKKAAHLAKLAGRRVLVVEDSELNRDVAVALLEDTGLVVETAENGRVALDKVTESETGFYDVVLMDIQMPVMDGYEATKKIRAFEKQQYATVEQPKTGNQKPLTKTPIIALTAHALKGEKEKCVAADMDGYLSKPLDEQDLHRMLLKWIADNQVKNNGSSSA